MSAKVSTWDAHQTAQLYAVGTSAEEIAELTDVDVRTVYRRLNDPEVVRITREIRRLNFEAVCGLLQGRTRKSSDVIQELLASKDEKIRLSAAKAQMEFGSRARGDEERDIEMNRLREELDELKKAARTTP